VVVQAQLSLCFILKLIVNLEYHFFRLQIRSRMWDAHLVIDGGISYKFNDGATASLEIHEEDALKSVVFD